VSRISALVLLLFAAGCSLTPTESDVRTKIAGNFCNDNYRLELSNAHYRNTRKNGGIPPEICEGTYALALGEGRWEIHYLPDTLNGVIATQCEKIFTLWTEKDGYLIGTDTVIMRDLFDNKPLKRCAE